MSTLPAETVASAIHFIRGQRVILDADLAHLYGVETRVLIQAVKRNPQRFPQDFMLQVTQVELENLRSQFVISSWQRGDYGGRRYLPYAFTEQGVAMLSSVLRSERAVAVNIEIMRAFVRLRGLLAEHKELARRIGELEQKHDRKFAVVFEAIRKLMEPVPSAAPEKPPIGFRPPGGDSAPPRKASRKAG